MKLIMTKKELKERVIEEAKIMRAQGVFLTLSECKKEAEKIFREEFKII
jgi:hypothetical protein